MSFKIPMEGPTCLRCGTDRKKRLVALIQPGIGPSDGFGERSGLPTEFHVCHNRKACRGRQQEARPARMTTQSATDTRECGFMGCGRVECEPVCAGIPKERNT